jgi:hypothetical protein
MAAQVVACHPCPEQQANLSPEAEFDWFEFFVLNVIPIVQALVTYR